MRDLQIFGGFMPRRQRTVASLSPAAFYDPSDLATLFQDAAMTIPVTADGQAVGSMRDKSGNGHHLVQSAAASRPIYHTDGTRHWITFDGVDDYLSGGVVHGAVRSLHLAVRYTSGDAAVFYGGRSSTNVRSVVGVGVGNAFGVGVGTASNYGNTVGAALTGLDRIVYLSHDGTTVTMWTNEPASKSLAQSGLTTPGQAAFLGAMNNVGTPLSYFGGRFYGLIETATIPSDADKAVIRAWLAARI